MSKIPLKPLQEPVATVVAGHTFTIDTRYVLKDSRILGKGSFGVVTTAYDSIRKIDLAIKRIRPYANDDWDSRHTLREIRLLKLLGPHPNIITLYELSLNEPKTELYMMMEVMDCDLHRVIQSKQALSEKHFKCFMKQILEGVKAMHAIGVFHRDLKPGNILVSKDCQLRIVDFGLARFMDEPTRTGSNQLNPMTEYVVTRWYRCPELLLSPNRPYNEAIDLWSVGCILAELLRRKPLFPGKSHANQVQMIFEVLGYSNVHDLGFPVSSEASAFLDKRCKYRRQPLSKVAPEASVEALTLLEDLLALNPDNRPTAVDALEYPFLDGAELLHDYTKTYLQRPTVEYFDFEQEKYSALELKAMIHHEVQISAAYAYQYENLSRVGSAGSNSNSPSYSANGLFSPTTDSQPNSSRENTARPPYVAASSRTNSNLSEGGGGGTGDRSFRRASDPNMQVDENEGPASQLATQLRNSKLEKTKENPFRTQGSAPPQSNSVMPQNEPQYPQRQAVVGGGYGQYQAVRPHSSEQSAPSGAAGGAGNGNKAIVRSGSVPNNVVTSASADHHVPGHAAIDQNILTAVRTGESGIPARSRRSAPKTPSPQKIDAILQKDLNNKKRFLLEEAQRQREQDAAAGVSGSNRVVPGVKSTPVATTGSSYVDNNYGAAYQQSNQNQQSNAQPAASKSRMAFPSLSRISNFGSRVSGGGNAAAGRGETSGAGNNESSSGAGGNSNNNAVSERGMRGSQAIMHSGSNVIAKDQHSQNPFGRR